MFYSFSLLLSQPFTGYSPFNWTCDVKQYNVLYKSRVCACVWQPCIRITRGYIMSFLLDSTNDLKEKEHQNGQYSDIFGST